MSDKLVAETSTRHTTLTTDKHSGPGGIRIHNLSRRATADLCLRRRSRWDRPRYDIGVPKLQCVTVNCSFDGKNESVFENNFGIACNYLFG